jgi:uncharacterized membrane protein
MRKISLPLPQDIPIKDREDAMGSYLMMFAAIGVGIPIPAINLIASSVYFFLYREGSNFVRFHAFQSLVSQLPLSAINAVIMVWFIRVLFFHGEFSQNFAVYIAFLIVINILYLAFSIIAAVKARKGEFYFFIFFGEIAYKKYFGDSNLQEN